MRKKYTLFIYLFLLCTCTHAQTAWNKVIDFCPDPDRSSSNYVQLADDDVVFVAGLTKTNSISTYHCYLGAFNYQGDLTAVKELYYPGLYSEISPYSGVYRFPHLLAKISDNKYVFVANEMDYTINSKTVVSHPFFYIFDKNCDSIKFVKYTDTIITRAPYSIAVDAGKNIVVTGLELSRSLHLNGSTYVWDSGYVWLAKYDSSATLIWSKKMWPNLNSEGVANGMKIVVSSDKQTYVLVASVFDKTTNSLKLIL